MLRGFVIALFSAAIATDALAQPAGKPPPATGQDAPKTRPDAPTTRPDAPKTRDIEQRAKREADRISRALDLDEKQRQELLEMARAHYGKVDGARRLAGEMFQAAMAKDEERTAELREQLEQIRELMNNSTMALYDELEPILTDDQVKKLSRLRNRGRRGNSAVGADSLERLRKLLKLTDEQAVKYDEIVAAHSQAEGVDVQTQLKSFGLDLRRAREAGNAELVSELERKIKDLGESAPAQSRDIFVRLSTILDEKQIVTLNKFKAGQSAKRTKSSDDARNILRAAKKLDLSEKQRDELRQLEKDARKRRAKLRAEGVAAQAAFAKELRGKITGMLDAKQTAQFEKNLERLGKLRKRRRRTGGSNRP